MLISAKEFMAFSRQWEEGPKTQRFGQAFINKFKFACPNETDSGPCIFNESNNLTARSWIQRHAVDWSNQ